MALQRRCISVWKMGKVGYDQALLLQNKLVSLRKSGAIPDTLLSLQHPPTYTLGKRRTHHSLLLPPAQLRSLGAELHCTERGGDATFHGPGQAVLYPILSLREAGLGARRYVENLELVMMKLASLYGVEAVKGGKCETGVWVEDRKIGAIGVRISGGVTSHGLAFNVDPDLSFFDHIVPCGIVGKGVTSLKMEAKVEVPGDEVIEEQLVSIFAEQFDFDKIPWKDEGLGTKVSMLGCGGMCRLHMTLDIHVVAREAVLKFRPDISIVPYHSDVEDPDLTQDLFKQFIVALNGLDNGAM